MGVRQTWKKVLVTYQPGRSGDQPFQVIQEFLLLALEVPHPGKPFGARRTRTVSHPIPGLKLDFLIYKNGINNVYVTRISAHIKC